MFWNFVETFEGYYPGGLNPYPTVTLPSGANLSCFLPIFVYCHLFVFPHFYKWSWYYLEGYLTKDTFCIIFTSACNFVQMYFVLYWPSKSEKTLHRIYHCAKGILQLILGIFLKVLINLKHSVDILNECLDITVVVIKLWNVLGLPLLWLFLTIFCIFCNTFLE